MEDRLCRLLERDGLLDDATLTRLRARIEVAGGSLLSGLLEIDLLPEHELHSYMAAILGYPPARREEVMGPEPAALSMLPVALVDAEGILPFRLDADDHLWVAASRTIPRALRLRVEELTGRKVCFAAATDLRIAEGASRNLDLPLVPRLRRLANRVRVRDPGETIQVPGLPDEESQERRGVSSTVSAPSNHPMSIDTPIISSVEVSTENSSAEGVTVPEQELPRAQLTIPVGSRPIAISDEEVQRRIRGPLTPDRVGDALLEADGRQSILELALAFVRQYFDYSAVFLAQDGYAHFMDAVGDGRNFEEGNELQFGLLEGALGSAYRNSLPLTIDGDGVDEDDKNLLEELRRRGRTPAILIPVAIRRRVILFFYGDRSGEHFGLSDLEDLFDFVPRMSEAFELLIRKRKRKSARAMPLPSTEEIATEASVDSRESENDFSDSEATTADYALESSSATKPRPEARATLQGAGEFKQAPLDRWHSAPKESSRPQTIDYSDLQIPRSAGIPQIAESVTKGGEGEKKRESGRSVRPLEALGVPRSAPPPPQESAPEWAEGFYDQATTYHVTGTADIVRPSRPGSSSAIRRPRPSARAAAFAGLSDSELHRQVESAPPSEQDGRQRRPRGSGSLDPRREPDSNTQRHDIIRVPEGAPVAPASLLPPSQAPNSGEAELTYGLPKVIVNMGGNVDRMVHELRRCGPEDEGAVVYSLLDAGAAALPTLANEFPGPLWFNRHLPHRRVPRGQNVSAIARAFVAFGDRSVPYLAELMKKNNADMRYYATLVSTEFRHRKLVAAFARGLADDDRGVRTQAMRALTEYAKAGLSLEDAYDVIRAHLKADAVGSRVRDAMIRSAGELRAAPLVGILIDKLDEAEDGARLESALFTITGRTFLTHRDWQNWWGQHRDGHRIEWLIDALMAEEMGSRQYANSELKTLTQQYHGYHPKLPESKRKQIQERYQKWWNEEGKSRFNR